MRVFCVGGAHNSVVLRTIRVAQQIYVKHSNVKFYENRFIRPLDSTYRRGDMGIPILVGLFLYVFVYQALKCY